MFLHTIFSKGFGRCRGADFAPLTLTECSLQALPLALAAARDAKGNAFKDALELLIDVLDHVDNSGNIYDPDNFLAAALEALGRMHTDDAEVREAHATCQR